MRFRALVAAVAVLPLLAACGGGTPAATGGPRDMLANLPSCDRVPLDQDPEVTADVPGLMLPDGARCTWRTGAPASSCCGYRNTCSTPPRSPATARAT
ncbi:hypothetical protein, partial [Micromonospora sp. NPDC051296]|uniref:hypothetical protein n=1 Tax=Micromonospora sp. NPDC051296 TaxID=3155046 RepID=UPI00342CA1B4